MTDLERCLVCDHSHFTVRYPASFNGNADDAAPYFLAGRKASLHGQIMNCNNCGFLFTNPQFSPQEYQLIYQRAARGQALHAGLSEAERARGKKLARIMARYLNPHSTLLDFGCGEGGFLLSVSAGKKIGVEVVPLEGHKILDATIFTGDFWAMLERGDLTKNQFDVIVTLDVLEHLAEPARYMQALISLLKPGGVLFVTLPNAESLSSKILGRRWSMFLLEHLWYFTPRTLARWLMVFGLDCVATGSIPYDVPIGHVMGRLFQTFSINFSFRALPFSKVVVPIPVGLMYGVFKKCRA